MDRAPSSSSTSSITSVSRSQPSRIAHLADPSPYHLRALVLDYLCHNCFTTTARAFARDSAVRHLDADGDEIMGLSGPADDVAGLAEDQLRAVELRKEIRDRLLAGQIEDATSMLKAHFPSVLREPDDPEPVPPSRPSDPSTLTYIASTTVDPAHLALNLRIQAFVETARTVPLPHPSSPPPAPDVRIDRDPEAHKADLLQRAQKLYAVANTLRVPGDRAVYLEELATVTGLLVYPVPEVSALARYLSAERREAVADQINSAILYRIGQPAVSNIELDARYTAVLWGALHDLRVKPSMLAASRPPGVQIAAARAGKSDKEDPVAPFDLRQFLEARS